MTLVFKAVYMLLSHTWVPKYRLKIYSSMIDLLKARPAQFYDRLMEKLYEPHYPFTPTESSVFLSSPLLPTCELPS